jgi:magnesium chelatase family protein
METTVKVLTALVQGIKGLLVTVVVTGKSGSGEVTFTGMPESFARELRVRVISAMRQIGHRISGKDIVVEAPINRCGIGDLPVALGILAVLGKVPHEALAGRLFLGELSLDGHLRPVAGILPMVLAARDQDIQEVFLPRANAGEAATVEGIRCIPADSLPEVLEFLEGTTPIPVVLQSIATTPTTLDIADVTGHAHAKRALEIAAAGGHHVLMIGSPGSGKTMLARRMTTLLPAMTNAQALETTCIHSVAGLLRHRTGMMSSRPFRAPHHTASVAALVGGGARPRPGEVSLAHHGVLFLDEIPEWRRECLEAVRRVVDTGKAVVTGGIEFPGGCQVIAAMCGCPCGYANDSRHRCRCSTDEVAAYRRRVLAMVEWCAIHVEVSVVPFRDLGPSLGETSEQVRARVVQVGRFRGKGRSELNPDDLPSECRLLLDAARERLGLGQKSMDAVLKVARTIADLDAREMQAVHLSEAIQYRLMDR